MKKDNTSGSTIICDDVSNFNQTTFTPNIDSLDKENITYNFNKEYYIDDSSFIDFNDSTIANLFNGKLNDIKECEVEVWKQKQVQARKHKKNRINKKWLKIYGYRIICYSEPTMAKLINIQPNDYFGDGSITAEFEIEFK